MQQERSSFPYPQERKKEEKRKKTRIILIILAVILIQIIAYRQSILTAVGEYLIVQEPPQKADVIAILGSWSDMIVRLRGGVDLYKQGMAKKVFIPRMKRFEGLEEITKQGIRVPEYRDLAVTVLKGLGVPSAAIETSTQEVANTREEAEAILKLTETKEYQSILLVTSKYHSRRAYLMCRDALEGKATIISVPTPHDSYSPEKWWTRETDGKRVVLEYQKLFVYYWRKLF